MDSASVARYEDSFREKGFSVKRLSGYLRLVKAHCEVHVSETPSSVHLGIPVVRAPLGETFPERLLTYLADRNASPRGPGTFSVEDGCVWCRCEVPADTPAAETIATAADEMVAQVERLGPKILNLR